MTLYARRFLILVLAALLALAGCGTLRSIQLPATAAPGGGKLAAKTKNGFIWGVSTAGHQYEGKNLASQWGMFEYFGMTEERSGRAANGLELFEQDLDLAQAMGLTGWRMSIEWSRIEPTRGRRDPAGVAYYHKVLDAVHRRGMVPLVTLIHFTWPQWLEDDLGGWQNPAAVEEFMRHVAWVGKEYGSKIDWYLTFNEPNIFVPAAYVVGAHGPGKRGTATALKVASNWISAHKRAYKLLHLVDPGSQVSFRDFSIEEESPGVTKGRSSGRLIVSASQPQTGEQPCACPYDRTTGRRHQDSRR